jgi:hypothetical protein
MSGLRAWWDNPVIPISPRDRLRISWIVVVLTILGWLTTSALFIADHGFVLFEQVINAISWWALTYTALDLLATSDVRAEQEAGG